MMQTGNCSAELFDELQVQLILHIQLYLKKILKDPDMNRLQRQQWRPIAWPVKMLFCWIICM